MLTSAVRLANLTAQLAHDAGVPDADLDACAMRWLIYDFAGDRQVPRETFCAAIAALAAGYVKLAKEIVA